MAEETKVNTNTTSGEVTQESPKQPTTAPKVESKPLSVREQMFGSKIKPQAKTDDKPLDAPKEPEKPTQPKETGIEGNTEPDKPHGKSAKERVQESRREVKKWREDAEAKAAEIDKLHAELAKYKSMKPEEMTAKDQYREAVAEEKMNEFHRQTTQELNEYISGLEDPEMFVSNYQYYTPLLKEKDPWTISAFNKYPEKLKMYDVFFQLVTGGQLPLQEWLNAPNPMKLMKLKQLQNYVNSKDDAPADPAPAVPKKVVEDSVVPDLKKGGITDPQDHSKGAAFKRAFEKGIGR